MSDRSKLFTQGVFENALKNKLKTAQDMKDKIMKHPAFGIAYNWSKNDFELLNLLGRGRYSSVYAATEKRTRFTVAIKKICKSKLQNGNAEKRTLREIDIISKLQHPNILRLYTCFHDEMHIYLAIETVTNGELYKHLRVSPHGYFEEYRAAKYIYQVADALNYCHRHNVIHRYLRPENMFLTTDDNIKLSDFGWSMYIETDNAFCKKTEVTDDDKCPDDTIDQWCFGIMCYELLNGVLPVHYYQKTGYKRLKFPGHLSADARDLIIRLLKERKRISLIDVMQHSWVRTNMRRQAKLALKYRKN